MSEPTIPGYSIVERLGSGGFATVYRALDDEAGTDWAIKVLHDHVAATDDLKRFERERTTMQALRHENIVSVRSHGQTDDGSHYTVLEYVGGGSVRDQIRAQGALHWSRAVAIGVQICGALDVAHRTGVLHRDVKPANILLDDTTAKLTDFGIARLVGQSGVTAAQSIIGTLAYTPPELFHNKPFDGRGDIYQLGVTLYEMLLGRAPFTSAAADNKAMVIRRILDNPAPPLAQFDIPEELSDLLDEVLAKDPADRPQTAARFAERLNQVEVALGRSATPSAGAPTAPFSVFDQPETEPVNRGEVEISTEPEPPAAPDIPQFSIAEEDSQATLLEPLPNPTNVLSEDVDVATPASQAPPVEPPAATAHSTPLAVEPRATPSSPAPQPETASSRGNAGRWLAAAGIFLLAVGGVLIGTQLTGSDDPPNATDTVADGDGTEQGDDPDAVTTAPSQFIPFASGALAAPDQTEGVAFGSVTNSLGLTIVGASGSGTSVASQRPEYWTIGAELDPNHWPDFALDPADLTTGQRSWDIGVIDAVTFLIVGDSTGDGGTDGVAWFGTEAGNYERVTDESFTGDRADSLRAAVAEDSDTFLVAGTRTSADLAMPSLWEVTRSGGSWAASDWIVLDVGSSGEGILHDVAVADDLAVAVGVENIDGTSSAIVKIRRDDQWQDLLVPIPNAVLWGVTISGDRIVAVGAQGEDADSQEPIAVVSTMDGIPFRHILPVRGSGGIARDLITRADGTVVAVGIDSDGESTSGAVWQLLPSDELPDDRWTTRASAELSAVDGFVELWSVEEFDEQLFVFGRTESDDQRPAGAWMLDLS